MSDLAQGYSASLILKPGDVYRIGTGGTATVRPAYGAPAVTTTLTAQTQEFGPYEANVKLDVTATSGTASYALLAARGLSYKEELQVQALLVSGPGNRLSTLRRGYPLLRCPATTAAISGLGAGGGGGAAPTYQIVRRNNRNALEITFQAHVNPQTVFWTIASRKYNTKLHYTFEVEDAAQWNGGLLGFWYSKDGTFTDNVKHTFNIGRSTGWSGIHCVSPAVSEFTGTGTSATPFTGGLTTDTMTYASFKGTRTASPTGTTRVWLYEVAEGEAQSLPQIVIGADDGHMTWYTDGLPVLEKYGFSSYLAYMCDGQNGTTRMRDGVEWIDSINRGHHAVVHGPLGALSSLADYFTPATYAPYGSPFAGMRFDIRTHINRMVAAGLDPSGRGQKIYVDPQGNFQPVGGAGDNTIVDAMRAEGVLAARRAIVDGSILVNGGQAGQALYLPIIGHSYAGGSEATNITNLVAAIQTEIANGRSVILMFHEVRAAPTLPEQITPANLETIVAACAALVNSGAARAGNLHDLVDEIRTYTSPVHIA